MTLDPRPLVPLVHHRWTLPALDRLSQAEGGTGRLVELKRELGASRGGLASGLGVLEERGWIETPERHGHPLRPEFRLTERGRRPADAATDLHEAVAALGLEEVAYRKWSLPVLAALEPGGSRFGEISGRLPNLTDRALSLALDRLVGRELAERRVTLDARPPVALYRPTDRSRALLEAVQEILRLVDSGSGSG